MAKAVDALASIPGIEKAQADAIVHAGLLTLDALNSVEANDLKEIPGLEDSAEAVLAAAKSEIERRSAGGTNESELNHQAEEEPMIGTSNKSEETE